MSQETFYREALGKQFIVDVSPDAQVGGLTRELVEKYEASVDVTYSRSWQRSFFEPPYLIHIPTGRRILQRHHAPSAVPDKDWRTLAQEGVTDDDILGLVIPLKTGFLYTLHSAASSYDIFQTIRSASGAPPDNVYIARFLTIQKQTRIWGALLYTEEDEELAVYVRKHFVSLSQASGKLVHLFVVEKPENDWLLSSQYWKNILHEKLYVIWSTMGWLSSKPYDKSNAYDIARTLGVYQDQLPCVVLFDDKYRTDKIVFPISSVSPQFFRGIFSAIERALQGSAYMADSSYDTIRKSYEAIIKSLEQTTPTSKMADRTQYNFLGQTAFVNCVMIGSSMSKDTYNIQGANIQGPIGHTHAHDMTFQQVWSQSGLDLPRLAQELGRLRAAMKQETEGTAEQDEEIGAVAAAKKAAAQGDGPTVLQHLRTAGKWALGIAEKIGVTVAAEAIKGAM